MQCKTACPLYPNSDRESGFPHKAMSALHPKADMCSANNDVRFGPIADIRACYSITSSARPINVLGTVMPSALAVFKLMTNSTFADCTTGSSAGFSPLSTFPV
jgi:hypothetical protein